MSLYGALFSGVSGLTAQSSAMGAISDNITNVSTIGYKNTNVNFQSLVTKQTSSTFYSAGGVQSKPRQANDIQGLLQASTSQTDIAISGGGFFVVNAAQNPTGSDEYLYTRAGSFIQDSDGYLKNTAGFYLQGWPTDASGTVVPANKSLAIANKNVLSNDYLETVNLSRVGGSAAATTEIGIGANLPSNSVEGDAYTTDVQFFDTLGNPNTVRLTYTRSATSNEWDVSATPPTGTAVTSLYDSTGAVYDSVGQLEFETVPNAGTTVTIGGQAFTFVNAAQSFTTANATNISVQAGQTVSDVVSELTTKVNYVLQTAEIGAGDGSGGVAGNFEGQYDDAAIFNYLVGDQVYDKTTGTIYEATAANASAVGVAFSTYRAANPSDWVAVTDMRASIREGSSGTMLLDENGTGAIAVSGLTALTDSSGNIATKQGLDTNTFSVKQKVSVNPGVTFASTGEPSAFGLTEMEILNFSNGASDMNGSTTDSPRVTLDFGTVGENNGFTQYAGDYTPSFITQNGSRFGTFSGVTISPEGLVTALFDNGDTRTIFKVPVATFVNPNGLEGRSGNVWNATEGSGDYTLRNAGNGPAGLVTQASLEASTVDIGSEFTSMIVVQRAYSASTKIISTADQMLEELMRTKR